MWLHAWWALTSLRDALGECLLLLSVYHDSSSMELASEDQKRELGNRTAGETWSTVHSPRCSSSGREWWLMKSWVGREMKVGLSVRLRGARRHWCHWSMMLSRCATNALKGPWEWGKGEWWVDEGWENSPRAARIRTGVWFANRVGKGFLGW